MSEIDKPEELKSHFSFESLNWPLLHAATGSHGLCSVLLVIIFLWAVLPGGLCPLLLFQQKQSQSNVLVPAFFWKIKSEIAANVPVSLCSNEKTSTPVSKLTLKPEQPPQEQACRSNCTGEVCFFFHRCVKVAHDRTTRCVTPISCDIIDFQVYGHIPKSPHESGLQLAMTLAIQKGNGFSCSHKYQNCAKEDYRKCHCNPAHPSGPSQVGFVCFSWNLSQSSTEIRMGDNITRSGWFCSV